MGHAFTTGLSNGERKRASIACELMTSPQLLILDVSASVIFYNTTVCIVICNTPTTCQSKFANAFRRAKTVNSTPSHHFSCFVSNSSDGDHLLTYLQEICCRRVTDAETAAAFGLHVHIDFFCKIRIVKH